MAPGVRWRTDCLVAAVLGLKAGLGGASDPESQRPEHHDEFTFVHWPHRDACWRAGRPRHCCDVPEGQSNWMGCWDDFWTRSYCCGETVLHETDSAEGDCVTEDPLVSPSPQEPFMFLWDEKVGGSTFNRWLLESAVHGKFLNRTHLSDFWWPNLIGAPYFLKFYDSRRREELSVVSGSFDWRAVESMCVPRSTEGVREGAHASPEPRQRPPARRSVRCLVLLRDPVSRFVSYWVERSDRELERGGERTLGDVPPDELSRYLDSVRTENIGADGTESGDGCNREVGLCMAAPPGEPGSNHQQPGQNLTETSSFRTLGGPQNRLARMLDPSGGTRPRFAVAARRLERCTVAVITEEHRADFRAVLAHRHPWVHEVFMGYDADIHVADVTHELGEVPPQSYRRGAHPEGVAHVPLGVRDAKRNHWYGSESKWLRRNLSAEARQLIAEFNDVDTPLYRLGMQVFKRQAAEARLHFASRRGQTPTAVPENTNGDPQGEAVCGQVGQVPELNATYLVNHSWDHHFDQIDKPMTRFMTDGLKCLLTARAMQCARFLGIAWPDNHDGMIDMEEVRSVVWQAYPGGVARYLVD